ncbi:hypothetical protein MUK42_20343 [Musa troglodytarum]|uniref:Uncharacterized protein n=1 Tax=Musa troglodytarum TaxID=320322 RepID=A0A9E7JWF6_9LILI|nr:hypothetical protein MUK42_20343 [Musa troglodytarum]
MAAGPKKENEEENANGFPEAGEEQHYIGNPDIVGSPSDCVALGMPKNPRASQSAAVMSSSSPALPSRMEK